MRFDLDRYSYSPAWKEVGGEGPCEMLGSVRNQECPLPGGLDFRWADLGELDPAASRLRHQVFVNELSWISDSGGETDRDEIDERSVGFSLWDAGELVAYLRLTPAPGPFMIDRFFPHLCLRTGVPRGSDVAEISRLCVARDRRDYRVPTPVGDVSQSLLLYRELFAWCRLRKVRYLYFVTTTRVSRLLRLQGFPLSVLERFGEGRVDDQNLCLLDWNLFASKSFGLGAVLANWFRQREEQGISIPSSKSSEYSDRDSLVLN